MQNFETELNELDKVKNEYMTKNSKQVWTVLCFWIKISFSDHKTVNRFEQRQCFWTKLSFSLFKTGF